MFLRTIALPLGLDASFSPFCGTIPNSSALSSSLSNNSSAVIVVYKLMSCMIIGAFSPIYGKALTVL